MSYTKKTLEISTTGSRSSSQDRFLPVLSSQEPIQRRLEENPFVAIDPRPDPEELSHAPTSQVPRIHDSCHTARVVNVWNSLPDHVVDVHSLKQFETRLDKFWRDQDVMFDWTAEITGTGDRSEFKETVLESTI